jgi:allantoin racemase
MKIALVNPNTTASMTQRIESTARAVAHADTLIRAFNPKQGPVSIEGFVDEALAVPNMLEAMFERQQAEPDIDAFVIACFDDTGLDAARCLLDAPVIGIGEAACHMASLLGVRFTVVTTLSRSVAAIEHNLLKYGLAARCARVRAAEVPVLDLEDASSNAYARISEEIRLALAQDQAEAIVLGCAGMTDLAATLSSTHGVPVLDGVACAVKLAEGLAGLGLRTSKLNSYAAPRSKAWAGAAPSFMQAK